MELFYVLNSQYFGDKGLKKFQTVVTNSIKNKIHTEKFAQKHYSVNLKPNI